MMTILVLACSLLQDPKPGLQTVENRLKELDEKLTVLEKRQRELSDDNAAMEKKIADGKAARENSLRQAAKFWVDHFAKPLNLNEKQAADIETLRYTWYREDQDKPADTARWKARENALREKVSAEQAARLAGVVRGDLEAGTKAWIKMFIQAGKLDTEKSGALEKTVSGAVTVEEGILLPEAHPDGTGSWTKVLSALESALPKVSPALTDAEQAAIRNAIAPWKGLNR
jgi:hypothetical protein